jgi:hypothetical protein
MNQKSISILFFLIFLFNFISAVTIQENTQLNPTAINTTFILGNNLTFNIVEVYSTYLKLDNNTFFANTSSGSVNITIFNFTNTYKKWNESVTDADSIITYRISNFTSYSWVSAEKSGAAWQNLEINSTGYVNFDYDGNHEVYFELEPVTAQATTATPSQAGGEAGSAKYYPTEKELEKGYSKSLMKSDKINIEFHDEIYSLTVNDVDDKSVEFEIVPLGIKKILSSGKEWKIDLDNDGFYDAVLKVESLSSSSISAEIIKINEEYSLIDCDGCIFSNECYDADSRLSGNYCSVNGTWLAQFADGNSCDDNFQCQSNLCLSGKCRPASLLWKFLEWLMRLFNFGE